LLSEWWWWWRLICLRWSFLFLIHRKISTSKRRKKQVTIFNLILVKSVNIESIRSMKRLLVMIHYSHFKVIHFYFGEIGHHYWWARHDNKKKESEREREREKRKKKQGNDIGSSSFLSCWVLMIERKVNCLSKRRSLSISLYVAIKRLPLLFKDYRRLRAAGNVETYSFVLIVVKLCYPWFTRSICIWDLHKYPIFLFIYSLFFSFRLFP